jgi:beta-lactamase class A
MPPTHPESARPSTDLDSLVEEAVTGAGPAGTVSLWYGGPDGTAWYTRAAEEEHYAASTMKLPLLVAAYRREERGELDLDAEVPVHNRFASAADGSPFALEQAEDQDDETWAALGTSVPLRRLARHSIVRSGNLATNLLLERVGAGEVAEVVKAAGCSPATRVTRGIGDAVARECGLDNVVTAADLAVMMCAVASCTIAAPSTCEAMEEVLAAQQHRDGVPAGLPPGTYTANKTGWVEGVAHDVALVRPQAAEPYVVAVCTTTDLSETAANALVADLSRAVWTAHTRRSGS